MALQDGTRPVPEIEGLRAVAVLLVCLFHYQLWSTGGFVGVDVFLVLSGYLITGVILRDMTKPNGFSLVAFYGRRARRLLPAASLVLVSTLLVGLVSFGAAESVKDAKDALWSAFFAANVQNMLLTEVERASFGVARHYWSLSVEEQFYLVWPMLLVVASRFWPRRPQVGTAAMASIVVLASLPYAATSNTLVPHLYFSAFARAWELAAGGLFYIAVSRRGVAWLRTALGWVGLAAILRSASTFTPWTAVPGLPTLVPVCGTLAVLAAIDTRFGPRLVLESPPLQWLGARSYGIYLWHWPLLILLGRWSDGPSASARTLTLLVCVLLSAIMYHFVEKPVRFAPSLVKSPARSLALGAALTAIVVVFSLGIILVGG